MSGVGEVGIGGDDGDGRMKKHFGYGFDDVSTCAWNLLALSKVRLRMSMG